MAQTFTDWELIAWDDWSTDGSAQIVAGYTDPRVRYFLSPEETTLGKARDNAIQQARGEWVAFLDQDDLWTRTKLEKQTALARDGVAIIYGRTLLVWPDGRERDYDQAHEFTLPSGRQHFQRAIPQRVFHRHEFCCTSPVGSGRDLAEFRSTSRLTPDYYFYTALAQRYPARAVQEVVCRYRMHLTADLLAETGEGYTKNRWRLMDQWAHRLDPRIAAYRRMTYSTALALEEMRSLSSAGTGISRLVHARFASVVNFPAIRPRSTRIRRRVRRPYWELSGS